MSHLLHKQKPPIVYRPTKPVANRKQIISPALDRVYGSCRYPIRLLPSGAGLVLYKIMPMLRTPAQTIVGGFKYKLPPDWLEIKPFITLKSGRIVEFDGLKVPWVRCVHFPGRRYWTKEQFDQFCAWIISKKLEKGEEK